MFRAPRCPNCRRDYAGPRIQGGSLQPLTLKCGHTYCRTCLAKILKLLKHEVVCPQCKVSSPMPKGEDSFRKLLPDFYALGLATWANDKAPNFFAHKMEFQTRPQDDKSTGKSLKGGRPLCEECSQEPATCRCQQCVQEFCERCWSKLHRNNSKTKDPHQRVQIQLGVYGCVEHDMPREFYCKDDKEPICAYCGLTGSHRGHEIIPMDQQNLEVQDLLKPAFDTAKGILKRLYHSKMELERASHKVKRDTLPVAESIRTRFMTLHSLLQLREDMLLQEVDTVETDRHDLLNQLGRSVRSNIGRLETVMADVARSLKDSSGGPPNLTEAISILGSSDQLPCHVITESGSDGVFSFASGSEIVQQLMSHGAVEIKDAARWDLKTSDELPDGIVLPDIPDSVLSNSKLFSVTQAGKSELRSPKGNEQEQKSPRQNHQVPSVAQKSTKRQPGNPAVKRAQQPQRGVRLLASASKDLVHVVHIRSPAHFYVQRKSDRAHLEKMMKALFKLCESEDKTKRRPDPIVVGTRCCCKFTVDNCWYRAIIKTLPESLQNGGLAALSAGEGEKEEEEEREENNPQVEVMYIDYGNTEWAPVSRLCKIRPKYERQPDLAQCCSLIDIVSTQKDGRWTREASESFQSMVQGVEAVLMSVSDRVGSMLYVDLHQQPNNSIKDDMPVSLRDALVFLELACFISPESVPKTHSVVPAKRFLPSTVSQKGEELVIQVSHITDPQNFSAQEVEFTDYLDKMMSKIQEAYTPRSGPEWQVLCPRPGLVCMAFFEEDQRWYRAEIIKVLGHQEVEVQYVDYGNKSTIHYSHLRKMTDEFLKLSRLAMPCRLADVAPKDNKRGWTDESKLLFSQCVSFRPTDVTVTDVQDGVMCVLAFEEGDDRRICVNAVMVQKGLAETTGPGSVSAELLRTTSPEPKVQSSTRAPTGSLDGGAAEPVVDGSIPRPEADAKMEKRRQPLPQDDLGARGYGVDTRTPRKSQRVGAESPGDRENDVSSPTAAVASGGASGGDVMLRGPGDRAGTRGENPASPSPGKYCAYTAVHVSHVESPACIYVQLSTAGKDGLDSLLEAMTLHYKGLVGSDDNAREWSEDEICCALLVREGVWCRGMVRCRLPNNNAVVLFTDYGNTEVVSTSNIRPLEERFRAEAPFAIRCHLVNILPAGGTPEWTKTACDFLEERLNDLECFICKKGDLTGGSLPIDLLYELTDKEKIAMETLEDLASISELLVQGGLALRKKRRVSATPARAAASRLPHASPSKKPLATITTSPTNIAASPTNTAASPTNMAASPTNIAASPTNMAASPTPQSSGISSPNTTAFPSPRGGGSRTTGGEGWPPATGGPAPIPLDDFESFEGAGIQEALPQYLAPPTPTQSVLQIIITFISPDGVIHGLDVDRFQEFQQLMESQQVVCNSHASAPPNPSSLALGQCLCARFSADDMWYRARVIGITEDSVKVKYIDFGNCEAVPFDRVLPILFRLDVPQHSRECVLHGIQPKSPDKTWPPEAIKFLLEMLVETTCVAHVKALCVKGEPLQVELTLPNGESVVPSLLRQGLAEMQANFEDFDYGCVDDASSITDGTSTPVFSRAVSEDGDDAHRVHVPRGVVGAELEVDGAAMACGGHAYTPMGLPQIGVEFLISVSHLDEPDLIYVQYSNASKDDQDPAIALAARQLIEWAGQVTELANASTSLPFLLNPQPDMPCCVQYSGDEQWYRALMVDVVRKDIVMCHVKFVDYGTDEWVSLNSVRQLPEKFLALPVQCQRCRLSGMQAPANVAPGTPLQPGTQWPAGTIKRTVEIVSNKILLAHVKENGPIPQISLFLPTSANEKISICETLIADGLADEPDGTEVQLLEAAAKEINLIHGIGEGGSSLQPSVAETLAAVSGAED